MSVDVKVLVPPETAFTLKSSLRTVATTVGGAEDTVTSARDLVHSDNSGETASAAHTALGTQRSAISSISSEISSLATAVNTFAEAMSSVKIRLDNARAEAGEAGLAVSGDLILTPPASDPDYEEKKTYDDLDADVSVIRQDESTAHDDLQAACQDVSGVEPEGPGGAAGVAATVNSAYGWVDNGITTARWLEVARRGRFAPPTPPSGALSTLWQKTKLENWASKAGHQTPPYPATGGRSPTGGWAQLPHSGQEGPPAWSVGSWPGSSSTRRTRPTPAWARGRRSPGLAPRQSYREPEDTMGRWLAPRPGQ